MQGSGIQNTKETGLRSVCATPGNESEGGCKIQMGLATLSEHLKMGIIKLAHEQRQVARADQQDATAYGSCDFNCVSFRCENSW